MTALATKPVYSLDAYLESEKQEDTRHEYVAGGVYAMAGTSRRHNLISLNVATRLRAQTRGTGCRCLMADVKLRIENPQDVYYPDVTLVRDERDDHPLYATSPCIVVEVLSPSTQAIDRRGKRMAYQRIAELNNYVLADSETRNVEAFQRTGQGWTHVVLGEDQVLALPCGERTLTLALDDVFEDVEGLNQRPM